MNCFLGYDLALLAIPLKKGALTREGVCEVVGSGNEERLNGDKKRLLHNEGAGHEEVLLLGEAVD